jgi:hypothetical protein
MVRWFLTTAAVRHYVAFDPHGRRPFQRRSVRVERWTVHRLIGCAARPRGVPAAVPEASLMPDEHLVRAESVPVGAARRRVGGSSRGRPT